MEFKIAEVELIVEIELPTNVTPEESRQNIREALDNGALHAAGEVAGPEWDYSFHGKNFANNNLEIWFTKREYVNQERNG